MKTKIYAVLFMMIVFIGALSPVSAYVQTPDFPNTAALLISDEGEVYYMGYDNDDWKKDIPPYLFTLDEDGNIEHSVRLSFNCSWGDVTLKQTGDYLCAMYHVNEKGKIKGLVCEKYNKELGSIGKYDLSAFGEYIDFSSSKICYYKGGKIYLCDLDGKNKKETVNFANKNLGEYTILTGLAVNDKYITYTLHDTYNGKYYLGYYVIKSGKEKIYQSDLADGTAAYGDNMLYYSKVKNSKENYTFGDTPELEGSGKFIAIIDGKIKTIKTYDSTESSYGYDGQITNDGKIITWMGSTGKKGKADGIFIRIYENGELKEEKTVKVSEIVSMRANAGKIAVNYHTKENGQKVTRTMLLDY